MKVTLENSELEVKKLPIGRYKELLDVFKSLASKLSVFVGRTNKEIMGLLPQLIVDNLPEALQIISIGTAMPMEEVEKLGLAECIELIEAIYQVNKYAEVYEKIKKASTLLQQTNQKNQEIVTPKPEVTGS